MSAEQQLRKIWKHLIAEMHRRDEATVAPFTVGGKLNLSSPHIVGTLAVDHGGAVPGIGSPVPPPPDTYAYLTDGDGNYLIDGDGYYLFEYV